MGTAYVKKLHARMSIIPKAHKIQRFHSCNTSQRILPSVARIDYVPFGNPNISIQGWKFDITARYVTHMLHFPVLESSASHVDIVSVEGFVADIVNR